MHLFFPSLRPEVASLVRRYVCLIGYTWCASKGFRVKSRKKRSFPYSQAGSYQADSSMCFFGYTGPSATVTNIVAPHTATNLHLTYRHDWVVRRGSTSEEVRYVIDYYRATLLPDGSPAISLDVRPALDNFSSTSMHVRTATRSA